MKYITNYRGERFETTSYDLAIATAQTVYSSGYVYDEHGNRVF